MAYVILSAICWTDLPKKGEVKGSSGGCEGAEGWLFASVMMARHGSVSETRSLALVSASVRKFSMT